MVQRVKDPALSLQQQLESLLRHSSIPGLETSPSGGQSQKKKKKRRRIRSKEKETDSQKIYRYQRGEGGQIRGMGLTCKLLHVKGKQQGFTSWHRYLYLLSCYRPPPRCWCPYWSVFPCVVVCYPKQVKTLPHSTDQGLLALQATWGLLKEFFPQEGCQDRAPRAL